MCKLKGVIVQRSCERRLGRHCSTARCQRHSCGAIFGQVSSSIASTQLKWPARVLLPLARLRPIHGGHFADYPQPFLKVHRRLLFSVKPPWYCRLQSAAFFLPLTAIDSRGELLSCPGCFSQAAQRRLTRCVQTVQFSSPNSCSNLGKCLPGSTKTNQSDWLFTSTSVHYNLSSGAEVGLVVGSISDLVGDRGDVCRCLDPSTGDVGTISVL